ncbi:hypothetical protein GCM10010431_64580 [Streptomyces kunmingensis]
MLPDEVALDEIDEFLFMCRATTSAWPHECAAVDFHATEGHSWRLSLRRRSTGHPPAGRRYQAACRRGPGRGQRLSVERRADAFHEGAPQVVPLHGVVLVVEHLPQAEAVRRQGIARLEFVLGDHV